MIIDLSHTVPSAAPTSVNVSALNPTALIVRWEAVPCIEQNGDITGYSVQYRVVGSESIQNMSVSEVTETTISNLIPSTNHFIEVAAMNRAGIGVYSTSLVVETPYSGRLIIYLAAWNLFYCYACVS